MKDSLSSKKKKVNLSKCKRVKTSLFKVKFCKPLQKQWHVGFHFAKSKWKTNPTRIKFQIFKDLIEEQLKNE